MSSELILKEDYSADGAKVYISGEVDIYTAGKLKEKLYSIVDNSSNDVIIECKDLNYIDSTGLGIFVGALKKTRITGRNIHIHNLKDNIKKLFVITGLDKLFILHN